MTKKISEVLSLEAIKEAYKKCSYTPVMGDWLRNGCACPAIKDEVQGFITSFGRFVDRIEGAEIALKSGQITKLSWPPNLYSEDLW